MSTRKAGLPLTSTVRRHAGTVLAVACAAATVAVGALTAGSRDPGASPSTLAVDELRAHRVTVVEPDGKPRLVLTNKPGSPAASVNGEAVGSGGGRPGIIFFDGKGTEIGGLTADASTEGGHRSAVGGLAFDQLQQDQTVVLQYSEKDGRRFAGLTVQDRPDSPLSDVLPQVRRALALPAGPERDAALQQVARTMPPSPQRVFVGKDPEGSATLMLADGTGAPRIVLKVARNGDPVIHLLDATGKVTRSLP